MPKPLTHLPKEIRTRSGALYIVQHGDIEELKQYARKWRVRFIVRKVLHKNLRGKNDVHDKLYKGATWIFFESLGAQKAALYSQFPVKIEPQGRAYKKELARIKKFGYGT